MNTFWQKGSVCLLYGGVVGLIFDESRGLAVGK